MRLILSLGLSLIVSVSCLAQPAGLRSEGREFYLGYLHPSFNDVARAELKAVYKVFALVSSRESNIIKLSYFDKVSHQEQPATSYTVEGGKTVMIPIDWQRMQAADSGDRAEYTSCHITTKHPATVHYFSTGANSGGAYLALPVSAWGKKYSVASYSDNGSGAGAFIGALRASAIDTAGGIFTVIAAYDNTKVTITPTAMTMGGHIGVNQGPGATGKPVPYTVTLARGQSYMVASRSAFKEGDDDISASVISADKPVAVFAGHGNANVGDGTSFSLDSRDFMIEQMIPFEFWTSTGHISIPMIDSPNSNGDGVGEDLRVFVADDKVPIKVYIASGGLFETSTGTFMPPSEFTNCITPTHMYCDTVDDKTVRFMVVQYDLRNHGNAAPFPAPIGQPRATADN